MKIEWQKGLDGVWVGFAENGIIFTLRKGQPLEAKYSIFE